MFLVKRGQRKGSSLGARSISGARAGAVWMQSEGNACWEASPSPVDGENAGARRPQPSALKRPLKGQTDS